MSDVRGGALARGCTVLVVDDQEGVRHVTAAMLELFGYRVLTADGGSQALAMTQGQPLDAVLTDIIMPGMSGLELGARLAEARPTLPVIYMSGHWDEQCETYSVRPVHFIAKPFRASQLLQCVEHALRSGSGSTAVQPAP